MSRDAARGDAMAAAGIAALLVAFFPTTTGDGEIPTPWQVELGEPLVARIHLVAAAVFLLALAGVSYLFSRRDSANRLPRNATLHRVCTAIMLVACVGFVVLAIVGVDKTGSFAVLLIAEVVSTLPFGVSWLVKGAELRLALAADERDQRSDATASVTATASKPVVT